MADDVKLLDTKDSKLILQGNEKLQKQWKKLIGERYDDLKGDMNERVSIYRKRRDFYEGNQGEYSNVVGILKDTKQKRGHTNQVTNYAGKTVVKMAFGLANNPPHIIINPENYTDDIEPIHAQAVQDYLDTVLESKKNQFWKKTYRRGAFIQGEYGDFAIKTYIDNNQICITGHDNMETIMVGWNGNPGEFDFVIVENYLTPALINDLYGIKVNEKALESSQSTSKKSSGSWNADNQWATKGGDRPGTAQLATGKTLLPKAKVVEYDSEDVYAITIQDELVQLVFKDDITYPKVKYWTIVGNIPNPPSPWSIADIDYLMDIQIELNENDNRSADHLRVGNVQRYIAYNMEDFDPESIKTSSGQVIFVNDPEGKSRFEPLQTNINNFPDDQYHNRKLNQMYDMGLPKVNYGASGPSSGRSKAIDYQSSVDLTQFKRDAWELALTDIVEKIQILGNFLIGDKVDWFQDSNGQFITRTTDFDWSDALPISESDKIVNIANKFNMIGIPLRQAFKELGYRNPDAMIKELEKELANKDLMILRSKAWQLSQGLLEANNQAATLSQGQNAPMGNPTGTGNPMGASVNQPSPMLSSDQNAPTSSPMAAKGGTTFNSSASGQIAAAQQRLQAKGQ